MWLPEGGELAAALVNAIVLALWAALPVLILGYIRQAQAARKIRSEFALRKSEIAELDRAVRLYDEVCRRLETIERQAETPRRFWRPLFDRTDDGREADTEERDDLQAHAEHLRGTIARLKRRPLQRFYAWVHVTSSRWALAGAIAAYGAAFALAIAASQAPGQAAWADELNAGARHALAWYPLDARLFHANAVAAGFAATAAALFYLLCRARLRRDYQLEICAFKDLADSDPRRPAEPSPADRAASDPSQQTEANEINANDPWFAVLGLSSTATIEDVRQAYKTLIKQNHPDRVHGMAPVFRALAEAETKKINAAYRQALACLPQPESHAA
jgi:DnaJ-domain-containing protein 1